MAGVASNACVKQQKYRLGYLAWI